MAEPRRRVVLVAGTTSGIGKAMSEALAADGTHARAAMCRHRFHPPGNTASASTTELGSPGLRDPEQR